MATVSGETALHIACENESTGALSVLLGSPRCDAKVLNKRDSCGFPPFLVAVNAGRLCKLKLCSFLYCIFSYFIQPAC